MSKKDIEKIRKKLATAVNSNKKPKEVDARKKWYKQSYPFIITNVKAKKATRFSDAVLMAKLSTASWVAHICKGEVLNNDIEQLKKCLRNKKYMFSSEKLTRDFSNLIRRCNRIVNDSSGYASNIATVSKFLHFLEPNIFPILDNQVAKKLNLKNNLTNYYSYTQAIQRLECDKELWSRLEKKAKEEKVTVVRLIDQTLFS